MTPEEAIRCLENMLIVNYKTDVPARDMAIMALRQSYTKKELYVFLHGISLRLLSLRSSQHWAYDERTAKEISFLERLYEKVKRDIEAREDVDD